MVYRWWLCVCGSGAVVVAKTKKNSVSLGYVGRPVWAGRPVVGRPEAVGHPEPGKNFGHGKNS